jgi:uncharacterized iron-regulated membrane protein
MSPRTLRQWGWVHKWSSLVCTLFMLILAVTGLPLIFSDEISALSASKEHARPEPSAAGSARLNATVAAALAHAPGKLPLYVFFEEEDPSRVFLKLDDRVDTDESQSVLVEMDLHQAKVLNVPTDRTGVMHILFRLHVDLFAGQPGKLFLGLMGLLMVVAIVSGIVLYVPFMRKLEFGTLRLNRTSTLRWLDWHNLLGALTLAWALVVGCTGIINTWAELILKAWQKEQATLLQQGRGRPILPPSANFKATPETIVARALQAVPEHEPGTLAWPGTLLSTPHHFAVVVHGTTPITARMRDTLLVDAKTGEVLDAGGSPWYVKVFQLSQPLHFGDYGQLPLKILWAMLDLLLIVVLASGLALWLKRGRPAQGRVPA